MKHEYAGVYRVRARLTTQQRHSEGTLKKSAAGILSHLIKRIGKHGFALACRTYRDAQARISEMESYPQYLDLIEDTNGIYENLERAIKTNRNVGDLYKVHDYGKKTNC